MIEVTFSGKIPPSCTAHEIERAVQLVFVRARRSSHGHVSLAFISDAVMQRLNAKWRHRRRSTDVLSFPAAEVPPIKGQRREWGDIFVSPVYVRNEARRRGIAFQEEVMRVVIHGALHLLGYDHATEEEEFRMFRLQEGIVSAVSSSV